MILGGLNPSAAQNTDCSIKITPKLDTENGTQEFKILCSHYDKYFQDIKEGASSTHELFPPIQRSWAVRNGVVVTYPRGRVTYDHKIIFYVDENISYKAHLLANLNALREGESVAVGVYVINDVIIINALRAAALRGVRVLVIFQFCLMKLDRDSITDELHNLALTSNAVVRRAQVHGKVIIINNDLVFLGSSNLSTAGLSNCNVEMNCAIYSTEACCAFKEWMMKLLYHSTTL